MTERWRGASGRLGADLARGAVVVALALAIGWGCFLDRSGRAPSEANWTCTATLRSPDGAMDMAASDRDPYASRDVCGLFTEVEADWRRHLFNVTTTEPDLAPLGLSCVEAVECVDPVGLPDGVTCPVPLAGTELPDCGMMGTRCLTIEPATTDAGFDGRVDFGTVTVGGGSAPVTATVRNTCAEPVRLHTEEVLAGRDATEFGVAANGCAPRDDEERVIGRLLEAAGGADSCSIDFTYSPTATAGFHSAQQGLSQDTVEAYRIRLFGMPEAP